MDKEFAELKGENSLPGTTEDRKKEILKEMCDNLDKRNDSNKFSDNNDVNVGDLYKADGELSRKGTSDSLTEDSNKIRENLLKQNKYSKEHPYPYKDEE